MHTLIADSGSTKTDWILLSGREQVLKVKTAGINPYFQSREEISTEINKSLKPSLGGHANTVSIIHYYGAGCSTSQHCTLISECLQYSLGAQDITVSHDLLAAARALCNREQGIASILGTGSNSCLYDGRKIIENIPSTGYLWSDYGGGSQIGKYLIQEYFEGRLPHALKERFEAAGYNREVILDNVYKKGLPGKYLATVGIFAGNHSQHPFIQKILKRCFDSFFENQVSKYTGSKKYKVHTVGSIGYYFKEIISEVARHHGYTMGNVIQSPIEGLVRFHSGKP
jgi:N-acetylglucosamine kinase-like BadF-type ATPase